MARKIKNTDVEAAGTKPAAAKSAKYILAPGKSMLTKRGIIADGCEITAKDLPGGAEALNAFIESGVIVAG